MGLMNSIRTSFTLIQQIGLIIMVLLGVTIIWNPVGFMNVVASFGLLMATFLQVIGAGVIYALTLVALSLLAGLANIAIALWNFLIQAINSQLNSSIPTGNYLDPMSMSSPVREMWMNSLSAITNLLDTMQNNIQDYVQNSWILKAFS